MLRQKGREGTVGAMGEVRDAGREPRPDAVRVVYGIDLYNQCMTGGVAKTLNSIRDDADHVPCVLVLNDQGGGGGR